jgi:phosphate uptake regulator
MEHLRWTRKTVQIKSTFYVAVPLIWAESNKLRKHGEVMIELDEDGSLRLKPAEDDHD